MLKFDNIFSLKISIFTYKVINGKENLPSFTLILFLLPLVVIVITQGLLQNKILVDQKLVLWEHTFISGDIKQSRSVNIFKNN